MCYARCGRRAKIASRFYFGMYSRSFCRRESLFTRDDDENNNSGYGKLKTCQSFSNALLYVGEWIGRIAYVSHFQMFSYIFTFGIDSSEIRVICAGIIGIKI